MSLVDFEVVKRLGKLAFPKYFSPIIRDLFHFWILIPLFHR